MTTARAACLLIVVLTGTLPTPIGLAAPASLVIGASPSLAPALVPLAAAFEASHPSVRITIYYDSSLGLWQAIAGFQNSGGLYGGSLIHIIAPGGDELIDRLESKRYVIPGTRTPYAKVPLVLVAPEGMVEVPSSFEMVLHSPSLRMAVADPNVTSLGKKTAELLGSLQDGRWRERLDVAFDGKGVIDHVLSGQADVGVLFGPDAVRDHRVRVVAWADERLYRPPVHSMAIDRSCPHRPLCEAFLKFSTSETAAAILREHGYVTP